MSSDPIRAALERLIKAVDGRPCKACERRDAITAARAALAAALEGEPSDEELRDLWSWSSGQDQGPWPTQHHCFARAVLARWGRPAAPPAPLEGEVRELVAWLHAKGREGLECGLEFAQENGRQLTRAATLLSQLSAAAPAVVPDGPAVPKSREPASVAPEAAGPLSPAAQAVKDAALAMYDCEVRRLAWPLDMPVVVAALRAVADHDETLFDVEDELVPAVRAVRTDRILAIAAKLEGSDA